MMMMMMMMMMMNRLGIPLSDCDQSNAFLFIPTKWLFLGNLMAKFSQLEIVMRRSPTPFVYFSLLLFTGIEHLV